MVRRNKQRPEPDMNRPFASRPLSSLLEKVQMPQAERDLALRHLQGAERFADDAANLARDVRSLLAAAERTLAAWFGRPRAS
jgi:hypothetical protein